MARSQLEVATILDSKQHTSDTGGQSSWDKADRVMMCDLHDTRLPKPEKRYNEIDVSGFHVAHHNAPEAQGPHSLCAQICSLREAVRSDSECPQHGTVVSIQNLL